MMSIMTAIIGAVMGVVKEVIASHMKYRQQSLEFKHQEQIALMQKAGIEIQDRQRAGRIKDKGIAFTRRILSFALVGTLCTLALAPIFIKDLYINIPVEFMEKGWSFLFWEGGSKEGIKYIKLEGLVYSYSIIEMITFIVGFYFGSGGSRR